MKTPQEFMNKPLFEARLTYDEFTGRGKEMWDVTFTTSNGKGITKTRGMVGLPVGSKMGDIAKLWKKNHKSQKFVSAKYKGIREFSELVESKEENFNKDEWLYLGFKKHPNWPGGDTFVANGDLRKVARAKFKREKWKRLDGSGRGLKWYKHSSKKWISVIEFDRGRTMVTSMPMPSYMQDEI
jgi:hypothetical protein